nr:MAG TPA: Head Tail Connector Protein [Caudoviricetes sp.]
MLDKLKILLDMTGTDGDDELLKLLLSDATQEVLDYTRRKEMISELETVVLRLAVVYYNRIGAEGQSGHTEGGISRTFETDIPPDLRRRLNRYIKVRVI